MACFQRQPPAIIDEETFNVVQRLQGTTSMSAQATATIQKPALATISQLKRKS